MDLPVELFHFDEIPTLPFWFEGYKVGVVTLLVYKHNSQSPIFRPLSGLHLFSSSFPFQTCFGIALCLFLAGNPFLFSYFIFEIKSKSFIHKCTHTHTNNKKRSVHDPELNLKSNQIYLITFGLGHKSHSQQLWEVLGIFPKTHCEEYHRNPKLAGQWEDLPSETRNNPHHID